MKFIKPLCILYILLWGLSSLKKDKSKSAGIPNHINRDSIIYYKDFDWLNFQGVERVNSSTIAKDEYFKVYFNKATGLINRVRKENSNGISIIDINRANIEYPMIFYGTFFSVNDENDTLVCFGNKTMVHSRTFRRNNQLHDVEHLQLIYTKQDSLVIDFQSRSKNFCQNKLTDIEDFKVKSGIDTFIQMRHKYYWNNQTVSCQIFYSYELFFSDSNKPHRQYSFPIQKDRLYFSIFNDIKIE